MKYLFVSLLALTTLQDPTPAPDRHDKWKAEPHAFCLPGKPMAGTQGHECHCKMMCATGNDGGGKEHQYQVEDQSCEMYCTKARCACHPEETCDVPVEVPGRR